MVRSYVRTYGHHYGTPGVYWDNTRRRYKVYFTRNRRTIWIGRYQRLADAIRAAKAFIESTPADDPATTHIPRSRP